MQANILVKARELGRHAVYYRLHMSTRASGTPGRTGSGRVGLGRSKAGQTGASDPECRPGQMLGDHVAGHPIGRASTLLLSVGSPIGQPHVGWAAHQVHEASRIHGGWAVITAFVVAGGHLLVSSNYWGRRSEVVRTC